MTVPKGRNQKKTRSRKFNPYAGGRKRILMAEESAEKRETGNSIEDIRSAGSWLENEYLEEAWEAERTRFLPQRSIFDRPRSFLDEDDDYNPDVGNDLDDFCDLE